MRMTSPWRAFVLFQQRCQERLNWRLQRSTRGFAPRQQGRLDQASQAWQRMVKQHYPWQPVPIYVRSNP